MAIRTLPQHEPSAWMQGVVTSMLRAEREGRVERCCAQARMWPVWSPYRMVCPAHESFVAGDRASELSCDRCATGLGSAADLRFVTRLDPGSLVVIVTALCAACSDLESGSAS